MSNSAIASIKNKMIEFNSLEASIVDGIYNGEVSIGDIPESLFSTRIVIALLLKNASNYKDLPFTQRCKEYALLATQRDRSVFEELTENKSLPIEVYSWVASNTQKPVLMFFPKVLLDENFCTEAIRINAENIVHLPSDMYEDKSYLIKLVEISAKALKYVPVEYVNEELCEIAFNKSDFDLSFIPLQFRTKEFCERAYRKSYKSIFSIPVEFYTGDMLSSAIAETVDGELQNLIENVPVELQTDKFWKAVVKKDSRLMRLVPENTITEHFIYDVAPYIKKASHLHHVKKSILENVNIKYRLIECEPLLLEALPNTAKDEALCYQAVSANGMALEFTPAVYHSSRMFDAALANNGLSIKHIPTPYRDEHIPLKAVTQNGEAIEYVSSQYVDLELCRTAITNNARAIYFLPKQFKREYSLYLLAIQKNPKDLKIIAEDFRSTEICRIAFRENPKNWDYIPVDVRTDNEILALYKSYKKEGFFSNELQSDGS